MGCGQVGSKVKSPTRKSSFVIIPIQTREGLKEARVPNQLVAYQAKAIVFSCMDFRLLDDIVLFMNELGYNNNYDQFILAGCSLAFINEQFKSWRKTAKDHLDLAITLHHIQEVFCIEHEKCGAYRLAYTEMTPEEEPNYHKENVLKFEEKIKKSYPDLKVHAYYMHIDGTCEKLN